MDDWRFYLGSAIVVIGILIAGSIGLKSFMERGNELLYKALAERCKTIWAQSVYPSKFENRICYVKSELGWLPEREFLRLKDVSNSR